MYWSPEKIVQIVYFVALAAGLTYLFRISKRGSDARRIAWFLVWFNWVPFMAVFAYTWKGMLLLSSAGLREEPVMIAIAVASLPLMIVAGFQTVYRLGFAFNPLEERIVTWLLALPGALGMTAVLVPTTATQAYGRVLAQYVLVLFIAWMMIVLVRKTIRARRGEGSHRDRKLILIFMLGLAAMVVIQGSSVVSALRFIPGELAGAVSLIGSLSMSMALFLGVLLFGEDRHSIQAKLLGFLAAVFSIVFALSISFSTAPLDYLKESQGPPDLESLSIRPDGQGGYVSEPSESAWVEGGQLFSQVDEEWMQEFDLPFSFPIGGQSYAKAWVGLNGVISFGEKLNLGEGWFYGIERMRDIPSVAPLFADMDLFDPAGGIRVLPTDSSFVVSWERVSRYGMPGLLTTFQAILHPDGSVDFHYGELVALPQHRVRGVASGRGFSMASFGELTATSDASGSLLGETDDMDAYVELMTRESRPLLFVGLFGLLLTGGIGFFFYRIGLVRPLEQVLTGLQQVEQGDLSVRLRVEERNELGAMSDHFNEMTASLQSYNERMEELVEARTAELKATQAQLVEQEKLASLGSLTAGIAHEIKNPLNFVNNFAEVGGELADELAEAIEAGNTEEAQQILEELKANATQIAKHGKRADSIVQGMMQHARGGASDMETVVVNDFLEEYANLAWHGRRARDHGFQAEIKRDFDPEVGSLQVMPQELGRVVLNLLNNAFDAVAQAEGARITLTSQRTANKVAISVSDNGPGIPEDIRQKIFEPFFTTKATGEGTGLGLSLSYDIVTKGHGGSMTVGESPDGGALFTIMIPA